MALAATHIRFAKDLADKYGISDMRAYISGALYPDSRYVTGIDRTKTHPIDLKDSFFQKTDFSKGWLSHLVSDEAQYQILGEQIPKLLDGIDLQYSEIWIQRAALKTLQDIDDMQQFDIREYLPFLEYTETPNGESEEKVQEYNQIFLTTHANPEHYEITEACEMWRRFGVEEKLIAAIKAQAETYAVNPDIMVIIPKIYPEMLNRAIL